MTIDWLTVIAQIINFMILVYLLKRFLYQPVITAMNKREQLIAARITQAQQREQEAEKEKQLYQSRHDSLQQQEQELISEARTKADQEAQQLLEMARNEVSDQRLRWQTELKQEQQDFLNQLRIQSCQSIIQITKQVLKDLGNQSLEQQIIEVFLQRLATLDKQQRSILVSTDNPITIVSSFALDTESQARIGQEIEEIAGQKELLFSLAEEPLYGIEIRLGGQKIGWSVANYLNNLELTIKNSLRTTQ